MATLYDGDGATHESIADHKVFLDILCEIKEQLTAQNNQICALTSNYSDGRNRLTNDAQSTESVPLAERDLFLEKVKYGFIDYEKYGRGRLDRFLESVDEELSRPWSSEEFVLPLSGLRQSTQLEPSLNLHNLPPASTVQITPPSLNVGSRSHCRKSRGSLHRKQKPLGLAHRVRTPSGPDPYGRAPRTEILNAGLESPYGVDDELTDFLRKATKHLQDLPIDHRLHRFSRTDGLGDATRSAEATAQTLKAILLNVSNDIVVFDCNELHGFHIYSLSVHESGGHMRPVSSSTEALMTRAPWTRFIVCRDRSGKPGTSDISTTAEHTRSLHGRAIQNILKVHKNPQELRGHFQADDGSVTFQIKAFRLFGEGENTSNSNQGGLLSDHQHRLVFEAYSLCAVSDRENSEAPGSRQPSPYYTLLFLVPENYPACRSPMCADLPRYSSSMELHSLQIVENVICRVTDRWIELYEYMERQFGDGNGSTLVQHGRYDRLLFDDADFSRSRQYFWAIRALEVFGTTIDGTLEQWRKFQVRFAHPFYLWRVEHPDRITGPGMGCLPIRSSEILYRIRCKTRALERTVEKIQALRLKLQTHRNAVFTTSAVIESRAATRLGANVTLLTYISVFYLPLSFCATMWNIPGMPGLGIFGLVTFLVASFTYILVLNMNNLVGLGRAGFESYKQKTLKSMKNDEDPKWKARAKNLDYYRPQRTRLHPTAWLLPTYTIHTIIEAICNGCGRFSKRQPKDHADTELGGVTRSTTDSPEA